MIWSIAALIAFIAAGLALSAWSLLGRRSRDRGRAEASHGDAQLALGMHAEVEAQGWPNISGPEGEPRR